MGIKLLNPLAKEIKVEGEGKNIGETIKIWLKIMTFL